MLRYKNENLFVAECKFWKGVSGYTNAIDQLLGNLTARDSHAAIIMFSRRQNIGTVQNRVADATAKHGQYVKQIPDFEGHTVYRFNSDSGNPVKIAVKVFDLL